jgi:hypothetical protein
VAYESKLRSVASHGLVRWTALIARPRRRPIGRFSSCYRAGVAPLAGGDNLGLWWRQQAVQHPCHDKAAEYRYQAQEIRAIVQKLSVDEAREQLLETAARLEGLAEEEERRAQDDGSKPVTQSGA